MVPDFRRDDVWIPPYQVRGRLLKSGMTEKAVYGQTLISSECLSLNLRTLNSELITMFYLTTFLPSNAAAEMVSVYLDKRRLYFFAFFNHQIATRMKLTPDGQVHGIRNLAWDCV